MGGEPSSGRVPVYPMFLALALLVRAAIRVPFGWELSVRAAAGLLQTVVGTATVGIVGMAGRRMVGPAAAIVAAALVTFWPGLILMTPVLMAETLFTFLVIAGISSLMLPDEGTSLRPRRLCGAGALVALATLTRPTGALVVPVLLLWLWRRNPLAPGDRGGPDTRRQGRWQPALRMQAMFLAGFVAVLAPWVVRNAIHFEAFVPFDTNSGTYLCLGNHDGATATSGNTPQCPFDQSVEGDRRLRTKALRWAFDDPSREVGLIRAPRPCADPTRRRCLVRVAG